ncbi:ethanolamine ammonia-lyase subunit EutC [Caldilinea sp.]|uniref:ethanolamine ammonia-lyase subunit EutC n=1 Tax=Caldilinea sp. TaxID=2293560 RepID=UPI002C1300DA|nr:ethanolamine ammonia-lyase subunit EutC [Caldilinea sp.]HRA64458.1 ethanolamine ammonia-lyase subunit EutC [Caldilinea sp.]
MDDAKVAAIAAAVVKELWDAGAIAAPETTPVSASSATMHATAAPVTAAPITAATTHAPLLTIDLPDPTAAEQRYAPGVTNPADAQGLQALIAATTARIGVGRTGPRYRTASLLLFQADHAITQDALYRDVDQKLLDDLELFSVETRITGGKQEYLLRPDLGRQLCDDARRTIGERCVKSPAIQLVVGDGLSAAAIEANLRQILPIIKQGVQAAGLSFGTPFFVKHARVGMMNDIGELLRPEVLILLIGERPGLGRADSMSAYMAFRPKPGDTDADRDVICNIFEGGANPLEAGAFVVQLAQKMRKHQASGVKLKLAT